MKTILKFWIGLGILVILSPLGLIIPGLLKSSSAWGEWGVEEIEKLAGYVPRGLAKLSSFWNAPVPDYAFKGWEEKSLTQLSFANIFSAIAGAAAVAALAYLAGKMLTKKKN